MHHTSIPTDDVIDMINDISVMLGIDLEPTAELLRWTNSLRERLNQFPKPTLPEKTAAVHASQSIADIIAARIWQGDEELVDAAMQDMATREGWQFESHNIVLWTSPDGGELVVWLGNDRDYEMSATGRSEMKN